MDARVQLLTGGALNGGKTLAKAFDEILATGVIIHFSPHDARLQHVQIGSHMQHRNRARIGSQIQCHVHGSIRIVAEIDRDHNFTTAEPRHDLGSLFGSC